MDFSAASTFASLDAYTTATTTTEDGVPVPILERFVLARGERDTADQLSLNQVLLTCADVIEAGSSEERPDLFRLVVAARGTPAAGAPANPHEGRNAKRVLLQATGEYLWRCDDNGGMRTLDDRAIFPSAMPRLPSPAPSSIVLPPVSELAPAAPSPGLSSAQFHIDKRARTSESELDELASVEELFSSTPATTSGPEEPPLTAITGKVQFTAKYSALLQHTYDYEHAAMRDMNQTAASIEELMPMLSQLIELCRQHPRELSREHASISTLRAGVQKCVALKQPVRAALYVHQETHQQIVGATAIDHGAVDTALKNLKKLGGQSVTAEFSGWNRGLGGAHRHPYVSRAHTPPTTGRFSAGRNFYTPPSPMGRVGMGAGHYAPPRRGGGRGQGGRGRGQTGRGGAAGGPGRRPICGRCDGQGLNADHAHSTCPLVVCHRCRQSGHIQAHCPN